MLSRFHASLTTRRVCVNGKTDSEAVLGFISRRQRLSYGQSSLRSSVVKVTQIVFAATSPRSEQSWEDGFQPESKKRRIPAVKVIQALWIATRQGSDVSPERCADAAIAIHKQMHLLSDKELVLTIYCLAQHKYLPPWDWVDKFLLESRCRLESLSSGHLVIVLFALSILRCQPKEEYIEDLMAALTRTRAALRGQDIGIILSALQGLDYRLSQESFLVFETVALHRMSQVEADMLPYLLSATAFQSEKVSESFLTAAAAHTIEKADEMTGSGFGFCLWNCATLGVNFTDRQQLRVASTIFSLQRFDGKTLSQFIWALAKLCLSTLSCTRTMEDLTKFMKQTEDVLATCNSSESLVILCGMARIAQQNTKLIVPSSWWQKYMVTLKLASPNLRGVEIVTAASNLSSLLRSWPQLLNIPLKASLPDGKNGPASDALSFGQLREDGGGLASEDIFGDGESNFASTKMQYTEDVSASAESMMGWIKSCLLGDILKKLPSLTEEMLLVVAFAMATIADSSECSEEGALQLQDLEALLHQWGKFLDHSNADNVADAFVLAGTLKCSPSWLGRGLNQVLALLPMMTNDSVVRILWSLHELKIRPDESFCEVLQQQIDNRKLETLFSQIQINSGLCRNNTDDEAKLPARFVQNSSQTRPLMVDNPVLSLDGDSQEKEKNGVRHITSRPQDKRNLETNPMQKPISNLKEGGYRGTRVPSCRRYQT